MEIPEIKPTEIDLGVIQQFSTEDDFIEVSVDLLVEVGSYICVVGNIFSSDTKSWDSNQAVYGGHLVRLYKLVSAMLDQTCQHRREIAFMIARMSFECIINLSFLLKNNSADLLVSYKSYSLKHEKKLMNKINENIKKRDGKVLPIEERMLNSISKSFSVSEVKPEDIKAKELRNWGNKNIFDKANDVGLGEAYLAAFGGPSHNIHGNWQDLLEYHLEYMGGGEFKPNFDWHSPRPQYLNVIALHSAEILKQYLVWLGVEDTEALYETFTEFQSRVLTLDSIHEKWLSKSA